MRKIDAELITKTIKQLCIDVNYEPSSEIVKSLKEGLKKELSYLGKFILKNLLRNIEIAKNERIPVCQDTGMVVVFIEVGQDVNITGGSLYGAINKGVREAYKEEYFRKSIVKDPLNRINTNDNTPAVIHTEIVPGNKVKIFLSVKGAGSENMSAIAMLKLSDGEEGIENFVYEQVKKAGANPCPPIIVGIGIGGTFEKAAILAKKALSRKIGQKNKDKKYANFENRLLRNINKLNIGPEGLGGKLTALAVNIETYPCHIASLPVAVNINCHLERAKEAVI